MFSCFQFLYRNTATHRSSYRICRTILHKIRFRSEKDTQSLEGTTTRKSLQSQCAMKVRTVTIGVELIAKDLIEVDGTHPINEKLKKAKSALTSITSSLVAVGYEVQTQRVSFNNFEEWLLDGDSDNAGGKESASYVALVNVLLHYLTLHSIEICSIGCCSSSFAISLVPLLLSLSDCLYCSALFLKTEKDDIAPDSALILKAAHTLVEIAKSSGIFGCFRFCSSFNCAGGTPFFPASFHDAQAENCAFPAPLISQQIEISNPMVTKINGFLILIGLECADLLFIAFYGAKSISEGNSKNNVITREAILKESKRSVSIYV